MENHQVPTSRGGPQSGPDKDEWTAGRVQTLLVHYFQPDNPMDVTEAALDDWIDALAPCSQPAIDHACRIWMQNQPRRRPAPGDILSIAETFDRDRERAKIKDDLSPEQARAVEWAVMTGRMGQQQAVSAVTSNRPMPEYCSTEAEAAVYRIRTDPGCMTVDEGGVAQYRKMVRA